MVENLQCMDGHSVGRNISERVCVEIAELAGALTNFLIAKDKRTGNAYIAIALVLRKFCHYSC